MTRSSTLSSSSALSKTSNTSNSDSVERKMTTVGPTMISDSSQPYNSVNDNTVVKSPKKLTWAQIQAQANGISSNSMTTDGKPSATDANNNYNLNSDYFIDGVERESVFVPPKNQTGDGRTALNDKYGY